MVRISLFNLLCERDTEYHLQRTTNFIQWETVLRSIGPATNRQFEFAPSQYPCSSNFPVPIQSAFFRAIETNTPYFGYAIVAKQSVNLSGTPFIDSFDSSNPLYSTDGRYTAEKRTARAWLGVVSSATNAISAPGTKIHGFVATGSGGAVIADVGDSAWLSAEYSGIQPGHFRDDFNYLVPDVTLPPNFSSTPQTVPLLGFFLPITDPRHAFAYVLTPGDWKFGSMNFSSNGVYIEGRVRIWIDGDFRMSGTASVTLAPGATVEMYIGHPSSSYSVLMDFSGNCVINPTGLAANCSIFGFQNCTSMSYASISETFCRFYAPQADIRITGDYDFNGSVVGNYIRFSGTMAIHYDEALGR